MGSCSPTQSAYWLLVVVCISLPAHSRLVDVSKVLRMVTSHLTLPPISGWPVVETSSCTRCSLEPSRFILLWVSWHISEHHSSTFLTYPLWPLVSCSHIGCPINEDSLHGFIMLLVVMTESRWTSSVLSNLLCPIDTSEHYASCIAETLVILFRTLLCRPGAKTLGASLIDAPPWQGNNKLWDLEAPRSLLIGSPW